MTDLNAHLQRLKDEDAAIIAASVIREAEDKETKAAAKKTAKGKAANPSRGVSKLNKANTEGMSKLSSFFTKKEKVK